MFSTALPPSDPYSTVRPGGRHSRDSVRSSVESSRSRNGGMRDMYVHCDEEQPGKRMAHVGEAKGDYVQVTTFRYVGKGKGDIHVTALEPEDPGCASWRWCFLLTCLMLVVPAVGWVLLPEQLDLGRGSLFEQTFVTNNELIHAGPTTTTTRPSLPMNGLSLTLRIANVDYARLGANSKAHQAFVFAVTQAVVFYTGHGVTTKRTSISVRKEFETVRADIVPPCGTDLSELEAGLNFTNLGKAVTANLHTVGGWRNRLGVSVEASVVNCETFAAPCEPDEIDLRDRTQGSAAGAPSTGSTPRPSTTLPPVKNAIVISGAIGASAQQVNGVYVLQEEKFKEHDVFRKEKASNVWLAMVQGHWYVTDSQRKDDNTGGGWLYSMDVDTPDPADVEGWQEWDGTQWVEKPSVTVRWHGEQQFEDSEEMRRQMTIAGTLPWKVSARHSGCRNWKMIKLGEDTVVKSARQCGESCQRTTGCVGFNFFDDLTSLCAEKEGPETGPDVPGSCSLWNGTCSSERNHCWTNYLMLSK